MNKFEFPKYAIVNCVVIDHRNYGLIVQMDSGRKGFVDRADIFDTAAIFDEWPAVGNRIRGVVLGCTRDGRVRLSTRERDLLLVDSLVDAASALREWREVKEFGIENTAVLKSFYGSPNVLALLQWALAHPPNSVERKRAEELLLAAPKSLQVNLLGGVAEEESE